MSKDKIGVLLLLTIYFIFARDIGEENDYLKERFSALEMKKRKVEFIIDREKEVEKAFLSCKSIGKYNRNLFFSYKGSVSSSMSRFQALLNRLFKESALQVKSISWEEPVKKDGYYVLPISFRVAGRPSSFHNFLRKVESSGRLIRFYSLSTSKLGKDSISFKGVAVSFKIMKGKGYCED